MKFKALKQFFDCYFHQDWADEFESTSDVVSAFLAAEPEDLVNEVRVQLRKLLELGDENSTALKDMVIRLGCGYYLSDDDAYRRWLKMIHDELQKRSHPQNLWVDSGSGRQPIV
jgi:hypothetical protein